MFAVIFICGNQEPPGGNLFLRNAGKIAKQSIYWAHHGKQGISGFPKDTGRYVMYGERLKMAVQFPPVRSLQDFITDAQFTAPTFHDRDRMENRMVNNLIYYQTNYFLSAILILILVG